MYIGGTEKQPKLRVLKIANNDEGECLLEEYFFQLGIIHCFKFVKINERPFGRHWAFLPGSLADIVFKEHFDKSPLGVGHRVETGWEVAFVN